MYLQRKFSFDAAHFLPNYIGKCHNVHGHRWEVKYTVAGEKEEKLGMVLDFKSLKQIEALIKMKLDHKSLNDVIPNPTAENIAIWIYVFLSNHLTHDPVKAQSS